MSQFDAVQALMANNRVERAQRPKRGDAALLKGRIFGADGQPMTPSFGAGRRGKAYRYYVANSLRADAASSGGEVIARVPGAALDELVLERLRRILRWSSRVGEAEQARQVLRRIEVLPNALHLLLERSRIGVSSGDIEHDLAIVRARLTADERIQPEEADSSAVRLTLLIRAQFRGGRTWLTTTQGRAAQEQRQFDPVLANGLRTARLLVRQHDLVGSGARAPISKYERRLCRLAFLAPDIQEAILDGRQPAGLTLERLVTQSFPASWDRQREALGF